MLLWGFWLLVSSITYRCNFYFLLSISVAYYAAKKPYLVFTHVWWISSCVSALGGCEFLGIWKGTVFDCLFQMSDETDTFRCHRLGNQMCIHVDIPVCLPAISLWPCWCVSVVRYKGSCSARLATSGSPSCNMAHVITRWAPARVNAEQYRLHVLLYISFHKHCAQSRL